MATTTRIPFPSADQLVIADAGLETWLLFDRGFELPSFAAYPLAATDEGRAALAEYYGGFVQLAASLGTALVLDAPTWRANPDWAATVGHDGEHLTELITAAVGVVDDARSAWTGDHPCLISGAVGPRGDGYVVGDAMGAESAAVYHSFQIEAFATTPVDVVTAMTLTYVEEAIGIARAAEAAGLPVDIAFTVETDGRLPSGMPLGEAIEATDAATGGYPLHYMINCAHPTHFAGVLAEAAPWTARLGALRANASSLSHAELDEAIELDRGDPADLAARYQDLLEQVPSIHVVGGCCGTDHQHVKAIATAVRAR
jgi:homocysteine S-methyltransferase